MVLDNYLVFGAPQESGPSGSGGASRGTPRGLPVFIMHSAKTTLQHLASGNVAQINGLLLPPEKET